MMNLWGRLQLVRADLHAAISLAGRFQGANDVLSAQLKELAEKPKCGPATIQRPDPLPVPLVSSEGKIYLFCIPSVDLYLFILGSTPPDSSGFSPLSDASENVHFAPALDDAIQPMLPANGKSFLYNWASGLCSEIARVTIDGDWWVVLASGSSQ
jgi:hypothetical protein